MQAYWLACSLAAGGLIKFRTIGRREGGQLLRLGDTLINCQPVHAALGDSIAGSLPASVAVGAGAGSRPGSAGCACMRLLSSSHLLGQMRLPVYPC